ncbi:phytanoyl-CoA dioxygenase family protein [Roseiconus nitratireducens]|uniref:phytanoyl-CoA dioxygenase family protein n=1 Tax=Roseiconus nitratireducens TaxID=2605748 RepID=UPI001F37E00F|nr:phytanoyl-CoA dioxygenase family protein [Roseiconus nitratireducens]
MNGSTRKQLQDDGFAVLSGVVSADRCARLASQLNRILSQPAAGAIGENAKRIVGGRNLQSVWSGWKAILEHRSVGEVLNQELGASAALVRILFFDKPPGRSWNLALHRDLTIAVAQHHDPSAPYEHPTVKAGVPHVQADESLLRSMLTLRLHLDDMHPRNGPLVVVPGSHRDPSGDGPEVDAPGGRVLHGNRAAVSAADKPDRPLTTRSEPGSEVGREPRRAEIVEIACRAGDVFAMKPLLLHGSRVSAKDCADHRRVVHLEFAPVDAIQPPYRWYQADRIEIA